MKIVMMTLLILLSKLRAKIDNIKEAMGDKIYDIIGRLISEEDVADLYEELLRISQEKWEAKVKRIDRTIEYKIRILNEINNLLSSYKFDRTKLEDMKKNFQHVVDKDEVKRFVEKYLDYKKGKLEPIDIEENTYRIFLPKQTALPYGGRRTVEGTFRNDIAIDKNYTYLALGNPYVMGLVRDAAKPNVAILKHPIYKDCMLMIYKITINDGKATERNGKIIAFLYNNGNVESIDVRDLWGFEFSSDGNGKFDSNNVSAVILKNKEIVDVYADKVANDLLKETAARLAEIESKTEESILRYYIAQASEIDSKIHQYEQKVGEPNLF